MTNQTVSFDLYAVFYHSEYLIAWPSALPVLSLIALQVFHIWYFYQYKLCTIFYLEDRKYFHIEKKAKRRFCIYCYDPKSIFHDISGNPEPIRTKFYTLTQMGRFHINFRRSRSRAAQNGPEKSRAYLLLVRETRSPKCHCSAADLRQILRQHQHVNRCCPQSFPKSIGNFFPGSLTHGCWRDQNIETETEIWDWDHQRQAARSVHTQFNEFILFKHFVAYAT